MNSSTGWDLHQRLRPCLERRAGDALQLRQLAASRRRGRCSGPGGATSAAEVADRRARVVHQRAQLAQERREVLGRRLGRVDAARRGRRASRAGSTKVVLPRRSVVGSSAERAGRARRSRRAIAAAVAFVLLTSAGRSSRLSAIAVTARGVDDEVGQRVLVLRRPRRRAGASVDSSGLKYFVAGRRPCRSRTGSRSPG